MLEETGMMEYLTEQGSIVEVLYLTLQSPVSQLDPLQKEMVAGLTEIKLQDMSVIITVHLNTIELDLVIKNTCNFLTKETEKRRRSQELQGYRRKM